MPEISLNTSTGTQRGSRSSFHRLGFLFHGDDRVLCFRLNHFHEIRDFAGRLRRAFGQFSDLVGDDREPCSGFSGACRLDGGVERQQVGLIRNVSNRRHDL